MIEKILGLGTGVTLTDLGALAALTTIIVQVLKNLLPKKIPTQVVAVVVALVLSICTALVYFASPLEAVGVGIIIGLVTAFASMNGFDALKNIWERFNPVSLEDGGNKDPLAEDAEGEEEVTGGEE